MLLLVPHPFLHSLELKTDKVAAVLCVPGTLLVTRAFCSELSVRVPSWTEPDKCRQEPVTLHFGDVFLDVRPRDECDAEQKREADCRVQAARLEPDPLGSIASMYAFAAAIAERLCVQADNVYIKVFVPSKQLQAHLELTSVRARTTNALWQDMRDLTDCVDCSPDGLLRTQFRFVSFVCSLQIAASSTVFKLLHEHPVAIRLTMFGQRPTRGSASWEALSHVVDIDLNTLRTEYSMQQYTQLAEASRTLYRLCCGSATSGGKPASPPRAISIDHDKIDATKGGDADAAANDASFALQVTARLTIEAALTFPSERLGVQGVVLLAPKAALSLIVHHDGMREIQMSVVTIAVRYRDTDVVLIKPGRGVLQVKEVKTGILVKWRLQKVLCRIEGDLALVLNELYHSMNEKEQSAAITCGTCHQRIRLEAIDTHVCASSPKPSSPTPSRIPGSPRSPSPSPRARGMSVNDGILEEEAIKKDSALPKPLALQAVLHFDECEFHADSHLFHNVQQLMRMTGNTYTVDRTLTIKLTRVKFSTEATEFNGGAVFVPVLPLAFQMLECAVQDCRCWTKRRKEHRSSLSLTPSLCISVPLLGVALQYPERFFLDVHHASISSFNPQTTASSSSLILDTFQLRFSFSDGLNVCPSSHQQVTSHASIDRVRCHLDSTAYAFVRKELQKCTDTSSLGIRKEATLLFLSVVQARNVELTLLSSTRPWNKSQLKQIAVVADNQLGHLSIQSTLDFRTLLSTPDLLSFAHNDIPAPVMDDPSDTSSKQRRFEPTREHACRTIQRFVRGRRRHVDSGHFRTNDHSVGDGRHPDDDIDHGLPNHKETRVSTSSKYIDANQSPQMTAPTNELHHNGTEIHATVNDSKSSGSTGTTLLNSAEELLNPKKMVVGAANVFTKYVKSTQQVFETDVAGLATQSLGSAARLVMLPRYAMGKKRDSTVDANRNKSAEISAVPAHREEVRSVEGVNGDEKERDRISIPPDSEQADSGDNSTHEMDQVEKSKRQASSHDTERSGYDDAVNDASRGGDIDDCDEVGGLTMHHRSVDDGDSQPYPSEIDKVPSDAVADQDEENDKRFDETSLGISDACLDALPAVVLVLVQIFEHRLNVPINPREKVGFLCREIVRRFNELFVDDGVDPEISRVALLDRHGGAFSSSDLVGHLLSGDGGTRQLFFARPIDSESHRLQSATRVDLYRSTAVASLAGASDSVSQGVRPAGKRFVRCSQIPLPLAVALLANESEGELLRLVLTDGSYGNGVDDWPELALNAATLESSSGVLLVEVAWFAKCLEVTHIDAFVLCLQQLGLCTASPTSKFIGRVLRDRLKVDATASPLITAASKRRQASMSAVDSSASASSTRAPKLGDDHATFAALKELVQQRIGTYLRDSR